MARHVQDPRTGRMAGSIGDGKTRIPTPNDLRPRSPEADAAGLDSYLQTAFEVFKERVPALPEDLHPEESTEQPTDSPQGSPQARPASPFTFDEYSHIGHSVLTTIGPMMLAAEENSFRRSGIATLDTRGGSAIFEDEFAIPYLTNPSNQPKFREALRNVLGEDIEFIRFREPLENVADPNTSPDVLDELADNPFAAFIVRQQQELHERTEGTKGKTPKKTDRAWADVFIVARIHGQTVYLPVNIKCSEEKASHDNTAGWSAASFVAFGDSRSGASKSSFAQSVADGKISGDAPTDYYFWNFIKGNPDAGDRLATGFSYASFLEFPDTSHKVFRYNDYQSFPLQVNTQKAAAAREAIAAKKTPALSLEDRRKQFARMVIAPRVEIAEKELSIGKKALARLTG